MELTVGENSYMSLEEAEELIGSELLDTDEEYITWVGLIDDNKIKLIVRGTRLVDQLPFLGCKAELNNRQMLHWPRLINNVKVECPSDIKLALLKQVLRDYKTKDKHETKLQEMGVKSYSINKASISFGDKNTTKLENGVYNDIYYELLRKWMV